MKNKIIFLSIDSLSNKDFEFLQTLPNFKLLTDYSAHIVSLQPIVPNLNIVNRISLLTGTLPNHHGVINNELIEPKYYQAQTFQNFKHVKVPTLFHYLKKEGYRTANLGMPVMAANPRIDFNLIPSGKARNWEIKFLKQLKDSTTTFYLQMLTKYSKLRKSTQEVFGEDAFRVAVLLELISNDKADAIVLSLDNVANRRQKYGVNALESKHAILGLNRLLGQIIHQLKQQDIWEDTTIVLLGGPAYQNTQELIRPNLLLSRETGWQMVTDKQRIAKWEVYCKAAQGCAYIYRKEHSKISNKSILEALKPLMHSIEKIYTQDEVKKLGADSNCLMMLQAKPGYRFLDDIRGPFMESTLDYEEGNHQMAASSGYTIPIKQSEGFALVKSQQLKSGTTIAEARPIDILPTLLQLLEIRTRHYFDGKILFSLIND